ncbi:MAG: hypothetical protein ACQESC_03150 [Nanobdellota archaeon]
MEESFEQKISRNVQGQFAVYKTTAVVGDNTNIPNIEWEETDEVDKFFMFAKNLGAKVIYVAHGDEENEETGETTSSIVQVGFLHQGIMHHINLAEDDEPEYVDEEDDGYVESDEDDYEESDEYDDAEERETNNEPSYSGHDVVDSEHDSTVQEPSRQLHSSQQSSQPSNFNNF